MDHVENLRAFANKFATGTPERSGLTAAADEMERLRKLAGDNTFFMVWSEKSHETHVQHAGLSEAEQEAIRLAQANPGCGFYVMVPMGCARSGRPTIYQQFEIDRDLFIPF